MKVINPLGLLFPQFDSLAVDDGCYCSHPSSQARDSGSGCNCGCAGGEPNLLANYRAGRNEIAY